MCTGLSAVAFLALPSLAWADPDSPYFSQPMFNQEAQQVQGPWVDSAVNIPQIALTGSGSASSVDLGSICASPGGALGGVTSTIQGINPVLAVPSSVIGSGGVGPLFQGGATGGVSPGALGASASSGVLGALGIGGH